MTLVMMVWIMRVMMYMLVMFLMNNLVMIMLMAMLQIAVSPEEGMVMWTMKLMFVLLMNNIVRMP